MFLPNAAHRLRRLAIASAVAIAGLTATAVTSSPAQAQYYPYPYYAPYYPGYCNPYYGCRAAWGYPYAYGPWGWRGGYYRGFRGGFGGGFHGGFRGGFHGGGRHR